MIERARNSQRMSKNTSQRPYHAECTSSRPITEVKQHWALLVLGWETAWEHRVLLAFCTFWSPRFFFNGHSHLQRMEFIQWEAILDSFRFMFGSFSFRCYANCVPRRRNAKYGFSPRFFVNDHSHLQRTEYIEPWGKRVTWSKWSCPFWANYLSNALSKSTAISPFGWFSRYYAVSLISELL